MFDNTRRLSAFRLLELQAWAAAEFLDVPFTNGFLSTLVCHVKRSTGMIPMPLGKRIRL
jgi:hypothetical protein